MRLERNDAAILQSACCRFIGDRGDCVIWSLLAHARQQEGRGQREKDHGSDTPATDATPFRLLRLKRGTLPPVHMSHIGLITVCARETGQQIMDAPHAKELVDMTTRVRQPREELQSLLHRQSTL